MQAIGYQQLGQFQNNQNDLVKLAANIFVNKDIYDKYLEGGQQGLQISSNNLLQADQKSQTEPLEQGINSLQGQIQIVNLQIQSQNEELNKLQKMKENLIQQLSLLQSQQSVQQKNGQSQNQESSPQAQINTLLQCILQSQNPNNHQISVKPEAAVEAQANGSQLKELTQQLLNNNNASTFYADQNNNLSLLNQLLQENCKLQKRPNLEDAQLGIDGQRNFRRKQFKQNNSNLGNNSSGNYNLTDSSSQKYSEKKYNGVTKMTGQGKNGSSWISRIRHQGRDLYLGYYDRQDYAGRAHDIAKLQIQGNFIDTNFPRDEYSQIMHELKEFSVEQVAEQLRKKVLDFDKYFADKTTSSGMINGSTGIVNGQNGILNSQNGIVNGQNGMVNGQSGMINGQCGIVNGQSGMVNGQNGIVNSQNGMTNGSNGIGHGGSGLLKQQ